MSPNLTKKELKTLKNALGKQGLTLEQHEEAQNSENRCEILEIDCFSMENPENPENDGWYVGYGVEMNGVGISAAQESSGSSESDDNIPENPEIADDSSGFSSDPPSDDDEIVENENPENFNENRRESADSGDKGHLLYGIEEKSGESPKFFVDKGLRAENVTFHDGDQEVSFETAEFCTTNRFLTSKSSEADENPNPHSGYQMIGEFPQVSTNSEESEDDVAEFRNSDDDVTTSSGLWCNFVISPADLEKNLGNAEKIEISEEKSKTIPLDDEKLAQISAAMANFQLPTPPGWEGVSDSKILDFIKRKC